MKKGIYTLFCLFYPLLSSAQTGWGRGVDNDDNPFTFDTALTAFLGGLGFIVVGLIIRFLYSSLWEDKTYIKTISIVLMVFGALSLLPFIQFIWLYVLIGIAVLLLIGYMIYYIVISEKGADKEMKSLSYYLNVVWGGICNIIDKLK